ncbi:isochorismatase [Legionella norrlandica]|uniref:nicotinamidase n=1 Tax=Legionella norrlandica TaxID=1498499 RepID=A0A0A2SQD1_9GAMM|nr:bifunctional nicotinamidase/pyrazinamidase [Legionella norrlandica]KGP62952.1 isochorismatase [Legionella norrlandica]
MKTLIILDVQIDFMPGGALAVPKGDIIVPVINSMLHHFDLIIATQDWHPPNHMSFASNHLGKKPFEKIKVGEMEQTLWPDHCIQGSVGAQFHPQLNTDPIETIFRKGTDPNIDSYSGFYDNLHQKTTGLAGYLREKGTEKLYFCGLCADICVYFTIKDAFNEGFSCCLIEDSTQALVIEDFIKIKKEFIEQGIDIIESRNLPMN